MTAGEEFQLLMREHDRLINAIQDLEEDYKSGQISKLDYEIIRDRYERKLEEIKQKLATRKVEAMRERRWRMVAPPRKRGIEEMRPSRGVTRGLVALVLVIIVAAVATVFWMSSKPSPASPSATAPPGSEPSPASPSVSAPDFTLTDTNGDTFSLSDFEGRIVVLDLMATRCIPCREGLTHLKQVDESFGEEVVILSVSVGGDTNSDLRSLKAQYGVNWRFALDTDEVQVKYSAFYIPKICIIDKNQNIAFTHVGVTSAGTLSSEINQLL